MRKITISLLSMLMMVNFAYAGGLVTNTNQSAAWSRMLVRDASTSIDAVYFNPAGLTKLADGLYVSLSSQTIYQTQKLGVTHQSFGLNQREFTGNISAPVFPDLYIAYKTGKWAFSAGFNVVGGGGGAEFKTGVPMAELPIADIASQFAFLGVSGYSMDAYLKGTSMYFGIQAGISYAISPTVSVYVGGRYNIAQNSYTGYLKNIRFIAGGQKYVPGTYVKGYADGFNAAYMGLGGLVAAGAGSYTLSQAAAGNVITAAQLQGIEAALAGIGVSTSAIGSMSISDLNTYYGSALSAVATQLSGAAAMLSAAFVDQNLDVKQKGTGFTPIIGANFSFLENNLDIGIKYEFKTNLTLTNTTATDPTTGLQEGFLTGYNGATPVYMFPDGAKTNANIPSYLSVGIRYNPCKLISLQAGYHLYGDRSSGWTNAKTEVGRNYQEYGLGAEFHVSDRVLVSGGYLYSQTGVNQSYQNDLNFSLNASTVGLGGAYKISDKVTLQLGGYLVSYTPSTYTMPGTDYTFDERFQKSTWAVSAGLDFSFGKKAKKK
jgi:long-subunit fatty acid transport protein